MIVFKKWHDGHKTAYDLRDVLYVLKKARAKIRKPDRWIKKVSKDMRTVFENGNPRSVWCYCYAGAVVNAMDVDLGPCKGKVAVRHEAFERLSDAAIRHLSIVDDLGKRPLGKTGVIRINDFQDTTHGMILTMFGQAIGKLEADLEKAGAS